MSIYQQLGLKTLINADGKMTALGGSAVAPPVADAMAQAVGQFVVMDDLLHHTGGVIAKHTGAQAGCPTIGAAAGIVISTAAVIAGQGLARIQSIPFHNIDKCEIVIQKGHIVDFGGNVDQMIRMGGGKVVEVGLANSTLTEHVTGAINVNTAALMFIKSHHTMQKGMLSLEAFIAIGKAHNLPVIVDAAAEEDLHKYIALGADLVIYSGGKALNGPTSGFICGSEPFINACKAQYRGVGRAMKVSKEAMVGLITALELYDPSQAPTYQADMQILAEQFTHMGIPASVVKDEVRDFYRVRLDFATHERAEYINNALRSGDTAIYLRPYYINQGLLFIDPRGLVDGQADTIRERIGELVSQS